jgi:drug/metabolite transporter (DMT)-like permease
MTSHGERGRVARGPLFLGLTTTRREPPRWGSYAALSVVGLVVAVAAAVTGEPRWASLLLLVLAALMAVLVVVFRRRRARVRGAERGQPR